MQLFKTTIIALSEITHTPIIQFRDIITWEVESQFTEAP